MEKPLARRIDAINAGLEGWVPTIDGMCYGSEIYKTRAAALDDAEREAKLRAVCDRVESLPARRPRLTLVGGTDVDRPRLSHGIGAPQDEIGEW